MPTLGASKKNEIATQSIMGMRGDFHFIFPDNLLKKNKAMALFFKKMRIFAPKRGICAVIS